MVKSYSENNMKDIELYSKKYFFNKSLKAGITIDKNLKTTNDKSMYRIDMTEFCDKRFSYLLKCKIDEKKISIKNDIIKLGGESKLAAFTHTSKKLKAIEEIQNFCSSTVIKENKIKVILTSPMIIDNYCHYLQANNIKIAITGKPNYIGGYDMASQHKKFMKKAVPSGSVFIVEDDSFIGKNISDIKLKFVESAEERFRGFGSAFIIPFKRGRNNEEFS